MSTKRTNVKKTRKLHQRKPAIKGRKSLRGCPELYDELKKPTSVALTETAVNGLDEISSALNISRSEFIERIGRKLLEVMSPELSPLTQEIDS